MIPTLLRVCHRVHVWRVLLYQLMCSVDNVCRLEPLLYRVLVVTKSDDKLLSVVESAMRSKLAGFLQSAVWNESPTSTSMDTLPQSCSRP